MGLAEPQLRDQIERIDGLLDTLGNREEISGYKLSSAIRIVFLEDGDPGVRQMAVYTSAAHGSPQLVDAVWRVYQRMPISHAHWELKVVALHALARMGGEAAEGLLLRELRRRHWFSRARWQKVQVAAALALGKTGSRDAAEALERCRRRGGPELRAAAERSLAILARRTGGES